MKSINPDALKHEKLLLIMQTLHQLGYEKSLQSLQGEAGIKHEGENLVKMRELVMQRKWDETLDFVKSLEVENEEQIKQIILEQKYFQYLDQKEPQKAIEVMRKEIQPICADKDRLHELATCLMSSISQEEYTKMSLQDVFNEIYKLCYKSITLLQPKRLETLMIQAKTQQILETNWHPILEPGFSLQKDKIDPLKVDDQANFLKLKCHDNQVLFCQFSPNGKYLASVCKAQRLCVWEWRSKDQHNILWVQILSVNRLHSQPIHMISFSPCSSLLASCSQDQTAKVYVMIPEPKLLYTLKNHQSRICGLGWRISDMQQQQQAKRFLGFMRKSQSTDFVDFWEIYTGSLDGWVNIWRQGVTKSGFKTDAVTGIMVFKDRMIIEHSPLKKLSVWDLQKKVEIRQLFEKDDIVSSCMNSDCSLLLVNVSYSSPRLNLYSVETFQLLKTFSGYTQTKNSLRPCFGWFNQNVISIGSEDGQLFMWHKYNDRKPILVSKILEAGPNSCVNSVSFNSERPQIFALACDDNLLRIYHPNGVNAKYQELEQPKSLRENLGILASRLFTSQAPSLQQQPQSVNEVESSSQEEDQMMPEEEENSMDQE